VTNHSKQRPISPYLIGPYYRPQLTSMLSIASRLAGIFLTALTLPVMFLYLLAVAAGPESYGRVVAALGSIPGMVFCGLSLFFLCYHVANGIRHLIWDTGLALSLKAIYASGYIMLACAGLLFLFVGWRILS
jgi:succinate dehydrogenase / fumarate reductase cytochrome b subunit